MSNAIRSKMVCHSVTLNEHSSQDDPMYIVHFGAVWSPDTGKPDDENAVYGKATPWGEHKSAWNEAAAKQLEVGASYYVTFEKADCN